MFKTKLAFIISISLIQQVYNQQSCAYNQATAYLNCDNVQDLAVINISQAVNISSFRIRPRAALVFNNSLDFNGYSDRFSDNYQVYLGKLI